MQRVADPRMCAQRLAAGRAESAAYIADTLYQSVVVDGEPPPDFLDQLVFRDDRAGPHRERAQKRRRLGPQLNTRAVRGEHDAEFQIDDRAAEADVFLTVAHAASGAGFRLFSAKFRCISGTRDGAGYNHSRCAARFAPYSHRN